MDDFLQWMRVFMKMNRISFSLLFGLSLGLAACAPKDRPQDELAGYPKEDPQHPSPKPEPVPVGDDDSVPDYAAPYEQSVGFYSDGTLEQPEALPLEGPGFIKITRSRNRFYGSTDLVGLLQFAAEKVSQRYPKGERLRIGDLSQESGGKITLHASHQNGLDVDAGYYRMNHKEQGGKGNGGFDEDFVKTGPDGKRRVSENLDAPRNWELMKWIVRSGKVNRIFMDDLIKAELCREADRRGERKTYREVLRRLRHWPGHSDHFHLRLRCPQASKRCVNQADLPAGDGCPAAPVDQNP